MKKSVYCMRNIVFFFQGISVLEQEKLDNVMIEMDGTDNKCKPRSHLVWGDGIYVY